MTNREFLQQRLKKWLFPAVPCFIGSVWIWYFRDHSLHVDFIRDDLALFSGSFLMVVLACAQYRIARARFRCPRCGTNIWSLRDKLQAAPLHCLHCALDMDKPYEDRGKGVRF